MHRRTATLFAGLVFAIAASAEARSTPPAPEDGAAPMTRPTISLSCHIDGQTCEAVASGGSGEGYSFEWSWPFAEQYDADGVSGGDITCVPDWGWRTIEVTVTDSYSRTATASTTFFCPA